ncbi:MAG: hypothetical protein ABW188_05630, partial [Rhodococcus fascians]
MTSRRPGLFRRSGESDPRAREAHASQAQSTAVAAFLDMDKRQSIASSGVDAVRSMYPDRDPTTAWAPAEKACFDAGAAYLAAMEQYDGIETGPAQAAFQNAAHLLGEAAKAVDRFYAAHRDDLEQARSALAATPR